MEPINHQVKERLNPEQQQEIKGMVLNDRSTKYGIDREIWTGKIIVEVIKERWGVDLKTSRIYEILDNLNLSHQKAHRDCVAVEPRRYENADLAKQKKFVKLLKKMRQRKRGEKILFFDEFAIYSRPSTYYGWAEKNTRPQVPSDESRKRSSCGRVTRPCNEPKQKREVKWAISSRCG